MWHRCEGAVFSLLELHYRVDILDEWALLPQLAQFPVVVAPERNDMSKRWRKLSSGTCEPVASCSSQERRVRAFWR